METFTKLFEPGRIGGLELKNRIILAPLGNGFLFATKPDGYLTERHLAFYEARARGGVGMIQLSVSALGRPYATGLVFGPGLLSIADDDHIASARKFTDAIHAHGTKVTFQITHHGSVIARQVARHPPTEYPELMRVVAPTGRRDPDDGFETHSLTIDEIQGIIEAFGQAARRGKAAGFDAVRIQGCHGYLIHQFLSARSNQRTDEYGGSVENRCRFACEVTRRVRDEVGPDYPIIFRMNGDDFLPGGITLEEAVQHARLFVAAGADTLDVSSGPFETHHWQFPGMYQPFAPLAPLAARIKQAVDVPIITAGKIDLAHGERVLEEGGADFIQMARALMADADLPNKARTGHQDDVRPCIYCGHCQNPAHRAEDGSAQCTINLALGRELDYRLEPAPVRKRVVVIGGGTAGMEAARTLAERGHTVSLHEKASRLGGQWNTLAAYRPEVETLLRYQARGLERAGVAVRLNHELTAEAVREIAPDAVVMATGASARSLDVPGIERQNVVQAVDVLSGKAQVGQDVLIIGGRLVGVDVALFLAERGKRVSIISRSKILRGVDHNHKLALMEKLIAEGVRLYPNMVPDSITEEGVNAWWDSGEPPEKDNVFVFFKADTVVLAVGAKSENRLARALEGLVPEVYAIGDAASVRDVFDSVHEGAEIGRRL